MIIQFLPEPSFRASGLTYGKFYEVTDVVDIGITTSQYVFYDDLGTKRHLYEADYFKVFRE